MLDRLLISLFTAMILTVLYLCLGLKRIAAAALAICVHEIGHLVALRLLGCSIKTVRAELSGIRIDYVGVITLHEKIISAAAGPLAGVLYSLVIMSFTQQSPTCFWSLTSSISLAYSAFNLLPLSPLDGGHILCALIDVFGENQLADNMLSFISQLLQIAFVGAGLVLHLKGEGSGMLAAGIWLLLLQNRN